MQLGADALITSTHKTLPGYSASALLVARTEFLNADRLEHSFETTHTTSPAGAPLASIDGCRALLEARGEELLGELLDNVNTFKARVQAEFAQPIFLNVNDFPAEAQYQLEFWLNAAPKRSSPQYFSRTILPSFNNIKARELFVCKKSYKG
jgi:arginine/lysine/ornithine decarboxylase